MTTRILHSIFWLNALFALIADPTIIAEQSANSPLSTLVPIIPLPLDIKTMPLLESALVDPWLRSKSADNRDSPDELYEKTVTLMESLRHPADKNDKQDMTRELYLDLGILSYYLAGIEKFDQKDVKTLRQDPSITLAFIRRIFATYARDLAAMTTDQTEKDRALFHANIASQLIGDDLHFATEEINLLIKSSAIKELLPQIRLVSAIASLRQNRAFESFESMRRIVNNQNIEGKIILYLSATLALPKEKSDVTNAGITNGATFLLEATKLAKQLPMDASRPIFLYAVNLWRAQKGTQASWENPPIASPNFEDPQLLAAIRERQALFLFDQKDVGSCLTAYQNVAKELLDSPLKMDVDSRILDIYRTIAATDHTKLSGYFGAIEKLLSEYMDPAMARPNNSLVMKKAYKQLLIRKRNAGIEAVKIAITDTSISADIRRYIIDQLAAQIDETTDIAAKKKLRQKIAALHEVNKNYLAALDNYKSLLELTTGEQEKYQTLTAMSRIQSTIAGWPQRPPWEAQVPVKSQESIDLLYQYYSQLLTVAPPTIKWRILAHMGLLLIQENKKEAAYQLWSRNIDAKPANRHQQYAAGMILTNDSLNVKNESYLNLVESIRKGGIRPVYQSSVIDLDSVYRDALFANAERAAKESNPKQVVNFLRKFTTLTKDDTRLERATFLLADSYFGLNDSQMALKHVQRYINDFPDGPEAKYLLMKGIARTKENLPELSANYSLLYLKRFKKGPGAAMARETLAKYYLQKKWYAETAKVYKMQMQAEDLPKEQQIQAALAYMEIEKKFGDKEFSHWGALQVIRLGKNDPDALAKAYLFEANYFSTQNNTAQLANTAKSLAALDNSIPVIRRTLAYVKNLLAQRGAETQLNSSRAMSFEDPKNALHELYAGYLQQKKVLDSKCKKSSVKECQVARREALRFAQTSLIQMEKIKTQNSNDSKNAESIQQYRNNLTLKIKQLKESSLEGK